MGVCGLCKKEMLDENPCISGKAIKFTTGEIEEAVTVGSRWTDGACLACGSPQGSYHHPGCDWEECPKCGGQLLGCKCKVGNHIHLG